jgi:hypothetical protein
MISRRILPWRTAIVTIPSGATATGSASGSARTWGKAGKSQALHLVRALSGFTVSPAPQSGDNLTRFGPCGRAM